MLHLNAIREMVKNSATDRRSMSKMEDAILDLDKLVSSMASRKDHHECKVRSVQNTVRALKPIVQRVRGMEANSSSHFKDAHASELPGEMRQHFGRTARGPSHTVLVGAAIASKNLCGAVTNTLKENSFVAIIESLASTPLVSSLSSATVSGMSAFMDESAAKVLDSMLEMMLELKNCLENFFEMSRCHDS